LLLLSFLIVTNAGSTNGLFAGPDYTHTSERPQVYTHPVVGGSKLWLDIVLGFDEEAQAIKRADFVEVCTT
jgi:hypothetical protein